MGNYLTDTIGLDTSFDQRFGDWGSSSPNRSADITSILSGGTPKASDPNVISQTKETETTVGTETTQRTETSTSTVGGAVGAYLIRGTVIILGFVFVAVGLAKFGGEGTARVIRQASPL